MAILLLPSFIRADYPILLKPFEDECREKNLQVDKALIEWRNSLTSEDIRRQNAYLRDQKKKGKSGSGKLDDPSKPKHPLTSFFIFLKEFRDRNEGSVIELGSKAGAEWKAMSEEQKQVSFHISAPRYIVF